MRKFVFAAVAAAALSFGVLTGQARGSWLSNLIHAYVAPVPYGSYAYYGPAYATFPPVYGYAPHYGYYAVPYVAPYRAYWYSRGYYAPRYPWPGWHTVGPRFGHPWHGWWHHHW
jgi:hypothetical protein